MTCPSFAMPIVKFAARLHLCMAVMIVALLSAAPALAKSAWDQEANIKDAAKRLAFMHRAEGSQGVVKFLDACYKTHLIASEFTQGLEACMAQDYIHSRVLAEIYAKLPEDARARVHAPSAELITATMNARFAAVVDQYKLSQSVTDSFKKAVDKVGMPIFIKGAFPPHKKDEGGESSGKDGDKSKDNDKGTTTAPKDAPAGDGK